MTHYVLRYARAGAFGLAFAGCATPLTDNRWVLVAVASTGGIVSALVYDHHERKDRR